MEAANAAAQEAHLAAEAARQEADEAWSAAREEAAGYWAVNAATLAASLADIDTTLAPETVWLRDQVRRQDDIRALAVRDALDASDATNAAHLEQVRKAHKAELEAKDENEAALRKDMAEVRKRAEFALSKLESSRLELNNTRAELFECKARLSDAKGVEHAAHKQLEEAQKASDARIATLQHAAREAEAEIGRLEEEVSAATDEAHTMREWLSQKREQQASELEDMAAKQEKIKSDLRRSRQALVDEKHHMQEECAMRDKRVRWLEGELQAKKKDLETAWTALISSPDHVHQALGEAMASKEAAKDKVIEVRQACKQEREVLVNCSLDSLVQLRDHLTRSLSGLRIADVGPKPPREPGPDEYVEPDEALRFAQRSKNRWGVVSGRGDYDKMVVQIEARAPPPFAAPPPIAVPASLHKLARKTRSPKAPAPPPPVNTPPHPPPAPPPPNPPLLTPLMHSPMQRPGPAKIASSLPKLTPKLDLAPSQSAPHLDANRAKPVRQTGVPSRRPLGPPWGVTEGHLGSPVPISSAMSVAPPGVEGALAPPQRNAPN